MKKVVRILQVEDSQADAELVLHLLKRSEYDPIAERVETAEQLRIALSKKSWDLVIADYRLPGFDAYQALEVLKESGQDIPFIVVSGCIGEDVAIALLKMGAHDYLMKDNLSRLAPAVDRELSEARNRQQLRKAEEERLAAYEELSTIYRNAPVMLLVLDTNLKVEKLNPMAGQLSLNSGEELSGKTICELLGCKHREGSHEGHDIAAPCSSCAFRSTLNETIKNLTNCVSVEAWRPPSDGADTSNQCFLISTAPLVVRQGRKALLSMQDISALKQAEHALRKTVEKLEVLLSERAILFQEVHHRVKNNLQIIASLLSMQSSMIEDKPTIEKLRATERRVASMAMIHEQLYSLPQVDSVDLGQYVRELSAQLLLIYQTQPTVELKIDVPPTMLTLDKAVPCGLILNELITNSLKHAALSGVVTINVGIRQVQDQILLTVSDTGPGLPENFDARQPRGLGMSMIRALTRQLNGELMVDGSSGATFRIRFPVSPAQPRGSLPRELGD